MAVFQTGALAGFGTFTIDGSEYPLVGEPTWGCHVSKKETMTGMSGVHGFSRTPIPGFIEVTLRDTVETSIKGFEEMESVAVTLELASGKRVSGNGLWCVNAVEVNSAEATYKVRFEGPDVSET